MVYNISRNDKTTIIGNPAKLPNWQDMIYNRKVIDTSSLVPVDVRVSRIVYFPFRVQGRQDSHIIKRRTQDNVVIIRTFALDYDG